MVDSKHLSSCVPCDEGAVMNHAVLQLDTHVWVRGYNSTVMQPIQGGDFIHKRSSAVERQAVPFKDHLTLGREQGVGVQLQRTI